MVSATVHRKATEGLIRAALRGALSKAQARRLAKENPEILALALLAASKRIAEQEVLITKLRAQSNGQKPSPSTPSGMVPIYTKRNTPQRYQSRIDRLNRRVGELAREEHVDPDARRLTRRLCRYAEYIFTFLDYPYVPHDNNFGERQIRPAVILRKNSQSNRSDRGAATQAVLMSV